MSILLNSTHEAQPWWDYDRTVWDDITPQRPLHQDEYFGGKGWVYSSADATWPSSKLIRGFVGSFGDSETLTIEGEFPMWTADVEIVSRALDLSGKFPTWTSDVHILVGEVVTIAGEVPKWTGTIVIPSEHVIIAGTFPKWSSNVRVLSGEIATISGSVPRWTSSITITPNVGAFVIAGTFPSWSGIINIRGTVSVYGATVMNAYNYAVTEYASYPIKSIGYMNGHYYGVLSDGVYLLEGDDDSGTDIDSEIETGPVNFAEKVTTYPREAWIVYRSDGKVVFRIREDEQTVYEKEIAFTNERLREDRAKFGRGLRDQFYAFGFINKDGADFDLDSIAIDVDRVRGRVR